MSPPSSLKQNEYLTGLMGPVERQQAMVTGMQLLDKDPLALPLTSAQVQSDLEANKCLATPLVCWVAVYPPEVLSSSRCSIKLGRSNCQKWVVARLLRMQMVNGRW